MSISKRISEVKVVSDAKFELDNAPTHEFLVPSACRLCGRPVMVRPDYLPQLWGRPLCFSCTPSWMDKVPAWTKQETS